MNVVSSVQAVDYVCVPGSVMWTPGPVASGTNRYWMYKIRPLNGGAMIGGAALAQSTFSNSYSPGGTRSIGLGPARNFPFELIIGYAGNANGDVGWTPQQSYFAVESGSTTPGQHGYFPEGADANFDYANGQRTANPDGSGARINGNGTLAPSAGYQGFHALTNMTGSPQRFRVSLLDGADGLGGVRDQQEITLAPGEVREIDWITAGPSKLLVERATVVAGPDGQGSMWGWETVGNSNSQPYYNPNVVPPAVPQANVGTPGNISTNPQAPVADQPRTGDAEANNNARNAELRGEIQRLTSQVKSSGDAISSNTARTATGIEGLGSKLEGISDALEGLQGESLGGQGAEPGEAGTGPDVSSIPGKLYAIKGELAAMSALFTVAAPSQQESWNTAIPTSFGGVTLNFGPYLGMFSAIRSVLLACITIWFATVVIKRVRGALAS